MCCSYVGSIPCARLPFISIQAEPSLGCRIARITAVLLGGVALSFGLLALCGLPGLNTLGRVGGVVLTTAGGVSCLLGFFCSCCSPAHKLPRLAFSLLVPTDGKELLVTGRDNNLQNPLAQEGQSSLSQAHANEVSRPRNDQESKLLEESLESNTEPIETKKEKPFTRSNIMSSTISFTLDSHTSMQAAVSQYPIHSNDPVGLTLCRSRADGSRAYCKLAPIVGDSVKTALVTVGSAHEKAIGLPFFNVSHTFTPTPKDEALRAQDDKVAAIFAHVQEAIHHQTGGKWQPELADVQKLSIQKAAERRAYTTLTYYDLYLDLSESAQTKMTAAGLSFPPNAPIPEGAEVYLLGVGQASPFRT